MPSPFTLDPDAIRCPYPHYEQLRARGRAVFVEELQAYAVTSYDDIQDVMRQARRASSATPTGPVGAAHSTQVIAEARARETLPDRVADYLEHPTARTLFTIDPPAHTRQRRLVGRLFAPDRVQRWEPLVRSVVDDLVDDLLHAGDVEFMSCFAIPLPVRVITRLLRLPDHDHERVKRWSDEITATIGNHRAPADAVLAVLASRHETTEVFGELLVQARLDPGDDLVTDLAGIGDSDDPDQALSESERIGLLINFLVAGNETTTELLGGMARMLGEDPDLLATLRADPTLIPVFVEEALRLETPSQGMYRQLTEDMVVGDVHLEAGTHVYLVFAAGNRDATVFDGPDHLDLGRPNAARHLSFGHGPHLCLGAGLARLEARIATEALVDRVTSLELAPHGDLEYHPSYLLHGLKELHLQVT